MYLPIFIFILELNSYMQISRNQLTFHLLLFLLLSFFSRSIFALLISCNGELGFCLTAPLTVAQAELIVSCLCLGFILFIPLLQHPSYRKLVIWLSAYLPHQTGSSFRIRTISQSSLLTQLLVNQRQYLSTGIFFCPSWAMIIILSLKD